MDRHADSVRRTVLRGAGVSVAVRVVGVALSYAANVLLSRTLGLQAFGAYVVALSWALVLTLPAKAGFDNSALRYSSIYFDKQDFAALRGFKRVSTLVVTSLSLLLATVIIVAGAKLIPVDWDTRLWAAVLILPLALLTVDSVILRTAHRIVSSQIFEQVVRPIAIIIGIAVVTALGSRLTAASGMALTAGATMVALLGVRFEVWRALGPARSHAPSYDQWRHWLLVSIPLLALGVVQELMNQIDIILLGQLSSTREAALFAASWRLASLVPFSLVGLATMAGPLIASAYDRGSVDDMQRVATLVARGGVAFAILSAGLLYILARPLLAIFGRGFVAGEETLSVLLLGGIVNAFTGVVAYFATLTGRERQALVIFAGALALSITLNLLLIPRYGAVGSAIASSAATAAWNVALLAYVRRTIGIDASALALPPGRTVDDRAGRLG